MCGCDTYNEEKLIFLSVATAATTRDGTEWGGTCPNVFRQIFFTFAHFVYYRAVFVLSNTKRQIKIKGPLKRYMVTSIKKKSLFIWVEESPSCWFVKSKTKQQGKMKTIIVDGCYKGYNLLLYGRRIREKGKKT